MNRSLLYLKPQIYKGYNFKTDLKDYDHNEIKKSVEHFKNTSNLKWKTHLNYNDINPAFNRKMYLKMQQMKIENELENS